MAGLNEGDPNHVSKSWDGLSTWGVHMVNHLTTKPPEKAAGLLDFPFDEIKGWHGDPILSLTNKNQWLIPMVKHLGAYTLHVEKTQHHGTQGAYLRANGRMRVLLTRGRRPLYRVRRGRSQFAKASGGPGKLGGTQVEYQVYTLCFCWVGNCFFYGF